MSSLPTTTVIGKLDALTQPLRFGVMLIGCGSFDGPQYSVLFVEADPLGHSTDGSGIA